MSGIPGLEESIPSSCKSCQRRRPGLLASNTVFHDTWTSGFLPYICENLLSCMRVNKFESTAL